MIYTPDKYEDFGDSLRIENYSLKNKFMNIIKKVFQWFVYSSANRQNFALTLKAGIPFLVLFGIDQSNATEAWGAIVNALGLLVEGVTGILTAYGLLRKIVFSFKKQ